MVPLLDGGVFGGKGWGQRRRAERPTRTQAGDAAQPANMGNAQGGAKPGTCGYRVLGVQPNSPASKVGLVSFFDFIIAADGEERRGE